MPHNSLNPKEANIPSLRCVYCKTQLIVLAPTQCSGSTPVLVAKKTSAFSIQQITFPNSLLQDQRNTRSHVQARACEHKLLGPVSLQHQPDQRKRQLDRVDRVFLNEINALRCFTAQIGFDCARAQSIDVSTTN